MATRRTLGTPVESRGTRRMSVIGPTVAVLAVFTVDVPAFASDEEDVHSVDDLLEMSLEELLTVDIVTAARKEQSQQSAPSVVTVVTADEIAARGYRSVGEALRTVPGLAMIDDLVHLNVGVRGIYADPVAPSEIFKLMINGQSVSFRPTSANLLGPELIPVEAVQRIEIIRGPTSALYGANAFLGVINIITRDDLAETADEGSSFTAEVAFDGFYTQAETHSSANGGGSLVVQGRLADLRVLVAAAVQRADRSGLLLPGIDDIVIEQLNRERPELFDPADGYPSPGFDPDSRVASRTHARSENDIAMVGSVYASATYELGSAGRVTLDGNLQYLDKHGEFQDYSLLLHDNRIAYYNTYLRLAYESADFAGFSLHASITHAFGGPLPVESIVSNDDPNFTIGREFGYSGTDAVLQLSYAISDAQDISLGVDYTADRHNLITLIRTNPATGKESRGTEYGKRTFGNLGVYGQWMWNPWPNVGITLGSRMDLNSAVACNSQAWDCIGSRGDREIRDPRQADGRTMVTDRGQLQLSNRAAVVLAMPSLSSYMKLIYGSSFKPPSPYQLHHEPMSQGGSTAGNPSLKPQTADSLELMLGTTAVSGSHLTLNAYYTAITDIVVAFKEGRNNRDRNVDARTAGVELAASVAITSNLMAYANASYLVVSEVEPKQSERESGAEWRVSSLNKTVQAGSFPRLQWNVGMTFEQAAAHLRCNVELSYVGERPASLTNNRLYSNPLTETYELAPYLSGSFTISTVGWSVVDGYETELAASVRGFPGGAIEPGHAGVDIPSAGPRLHLILTQTF